MILNTSSWTEIQNLDEGSTYTLQAKQKVDRRSTEGAFVWEPTYILFCRTTTTPADANDGFTEKSFKFTKDTRKVFVRTDKQNVDIKVEKE